MTTWTPSPTDPPSTTWTIDPQQPQRTFSPYTFSRRPVFDTGTSGGVWDDKTSPATSWTIE